MESAIYPSRKAMIKPEVLSPDDKDITVIGHVFDAPLVIKSWTWLPVTELVVWGLMARAAGRLLPERSWPTRIGVGALTMPVILGSEWCHNLAHAAAACWIGHPADAIRIIFGMPLLVYYDTEDPDVTPRQHIIRSLGGPVINTIFWGLAAIIRIFTRPKSVAREVANAAVYMNAFLVLGGMLPIPYIDGGAALKWALVAKGQTHSEADETLKQVNAATAVGMTIGAAIALKKRKRFLGGIFAMFGVTAVLIATGLLREKE